MIYRIGIFPEYTSWRARLARWLRIAANRLDQATVVILASENVGLKAQCVQGCVRMFLQAQAHEMAEQHAAEIAEMEMRQALAEWEPDERRAQ